MNRAMAEINIDMVGELNKGPGGAAQIRIKVDFVEKM